MTRLRSLLAPDQVRPQGTATTQSFHGTLPPLPSNTAGPISVLSHGASRPDPSLADPLAMEVHGMKMIESEYFFLGSLFLVDGRAFHFQAPGTTQFILDPDLPPTRKTR